MDCRPYVHSLPLLQAREAAAVAKADCLQRQAENAQGKLEDAQQQLTAVAEAMDTLQVCMLGEATSLVVGLFALWVAMRECIVARPFMNTADQTYPHRRDWWRPWSMPLLPLMEGA